MADIHDLHEAAAATADALGRLDNARELAFERARRQLDEDPSGALLADEPPLLKPDTIAILSGLEAVAFAIRELGVRLDYVTRDERVRAGRS